MIQDPVLRSFLEAQAEEGMELARQSDILELAPLGPQPAQRYLARFHCKGLIQTPSGSIEEADRFEVGISFNDDYLRHCEPLHVVAWLHPKETFHPNIKAPMACLGHIPPGTSLQDLLYQIYEIITYCKYTPREDDCLNRAACGWARNNQSRFPIDTRPLKGAQRASRPKRSFKIKSNGKGKS